MVINIDIENPDWMNRAKNTKIAKGKVYIDEREQAPQGALIQTGPQGGKFYDTSSKVQMPEVQSKVPPIHSTVSDVDRQTLGWNVTKWREDIKTKYAGFDLRLKERALLAHDLAGQIVFQPMLPGHKIFQCGDGENVLGMARTANENWHKEYYIADLVVNPDVIFNGVRGVGTSLLIEVTRDFLKTDCHVMYFIPLDSAKPFYKKIGFGKGRDPKYGDGSSFWALTREEAQMFVDKFAKEDIDDTNCLIGKLSKKVEKAAFSPDAPKVDADNKQKDQSYDDANKGAEHVGKSFSTQEQQTAEVINQVGEEDPTVNVPTDKNVPRKSDKKDALNDKKGAGGDEVRDNKEPYFEKGFDPDDENIYKSIDDILEG